MRLTLSAVQRRYSWKYSVHLPRRDKISEIVYAIKAKTEPQDARESPDAHCSKVRSNHATIERHLIVAIQVSPLGVACEGSHWKPLSIGTDAIQANNRC